MTEWKSARKKPIVVEYRDVQEPREQITTKEGRLFAYPKKDYIIRGLFGELYPIKKRIFRRTYEVLK